MRNGRPLARQQQRRSLPYNGIEFLDDFGLEVNRATYRTLDPEIGRWWQAFSRVPRSTMRICKRSAISARNTAISMVRIESNIPTTISPCGTCLRAMKTRERCCLITPVSGEIAFAENLFGGYWKTKYTRKRALTPSPA